MKTLLLSHFFNRTLAMRGRQTAGLLLLLAFFGFAPAYAQTTGTAGNNGNRGIFDAFITVKIKSANDIIYRLKDPTSGSTSIYNDFQGDIGTFFDTESLIIRGGDTKTYKNSGCDITGSGLYYYVHPINTTNQVPLRNFTRIDQPFFANLNNPPYSPGDQQWGNANNPTNLINVLQGLTPSRSYVIDVFVAADVQNCNNGDNGPGNMIYFSNGSRNYQVTFTLLPDPNPPLPVTLTRFEAKRQEANALMSWETASEVNNRGYEVQVSTDARTFRTLSFVPSQGDGTSSGRRTYSYLDAENGKTGVRYYRLRQLDFDGKETFYGPKPVSFSKGGSLVALEAAPNPFTGELTLTLPPQETARTGTVILTDMLGRTALSQPLLLAAGVSQARLPELDKLPKGLYHLRLSLNGEVQSVKLLKE